MATKASGVARSPIGAIVPGDPGRWTIDQQPRRVRHDGAGTAFQAKADDYKDSRQALRHSSKPHRPIQGGHVDHCGSIVSIRSLPVHELAIGRALLLSWPC